MHCKFLYTALLATFTILPIQMNAEEGGVFRNPVINQSAPDPTIIRGQDGNFYLYATEDIRNLPIYRSPNMVDWTFIGTAFTDESRPKWNPKGNMWAPDINFFNGKYVLYYAKSEWGGEWTCGIGVATADHPQGPFTDHGALFISKDIGVQNSIDGFFIREHGHNYLFWGSFRGIYGIELTEDGLHVKEGAQKIQVADTYMEATYIHKHGGYYYLFGSAGSCCEGNKSTYHVVYGRSKNLFGPYVDKQGRKLMDGHYETLLEGNEKVAGPGHNAEIITDDNDHDWMPYHGFLRSDPDAGRLVFMDQVEWIDGWPHIANKTPSAASQAPVFNTITLADPTIFHENGTYYLYGTSAVDGILVYTSQDLKSWKPGGYALHRDNSFGTKGFWAPQVFKHQGKYYMAYTANEQIAIAQADSPMGPFKQKKKAMIPSKTKEIDPFVFFDDNGKAYLYHVRLINGNRLYVAELNKRLDAVKEKTAREIIHVEPNGWENTPGAQYGVSEGPTVVKLDGTYYLFYSCNDYRNIDYAVGVATADNPLGPFRKPDAPIISRQLIGANGTGHGDLFKDQKGNWQYVFHTHRSTQEVSPRKTAVVQLRQNKDGFSIVNDTFRYLTAE